MTLRSFGHALQFLTRLPAPRFAATDAPASRITRGGTDKLVSNQRMVCELQTELKYPDYRDGLAAIIADNPKSSSRSAVRREPTQ